jgi:hypothetical protein
VLLDGALWLSHIHKVLSGLAPILAAVSMFDEPSFEGLNVRALCGLHKQRDFIVWLILLVDGHRLSRLDYGVFILLFNL